MAKGNKKLSTDQWGRKIWKINENVVALNLQKIQSVKKRKIKVKVAVRVWRVLKKGKAFEEKWTINDTWTKIVCLSWEWKVIKGMGKFSLLF